MGASARTQRKKTKTMVRRERRPPAHAAFRFRTQRHHSPARPRFVRHNPPSVQRFLKVKRGAVSLDVVQPAGAGAGAAALITPAGPAHISCGPRPKWIKQRKGQHKARAMDVTTNPTLSLWALHRPHLHPLRWTLPWKQDREDDDDDDNDGDDFPVLSRPSFNMFLFAPSLSQESSGAPQELQTTKVAQDDMNEWLDVQRLLWQEEDEEDWLLLS